MRNSNIQITVLEADDGKVLTNGDTYSRKVYLGTQDSQENWTEIPISELPQDIEIANI